MLSNYALATTGVRVGIRFKSRVIVFPILSLFLQQCTLNGFTQALGKLMLSGLLRLNNQYFPAPYSGAYSNENDQPKKMKPGT